MDILREWDARSLQTFLCEVDSETLIHFLWYMKSGQLLCRVLQNMSQRAAEMVFDDLENTWSGKDPDHAHAFDAEKGRLAISRVMDIVERLIAEGHIPNDLAHRLPTSSPPVLHPLGEGSVKKPLRDFPMVE
ncbi:hypothetical protein Cenrod_1644 [Candidatus Symbiobacter mobilis CR]|uniref:Flagellar motor switch protein FliG C-terminal domain-containing protein n=1 Tax=Candidatus Symbiobacter mobilis CR TaxID=946483 RepID=U5NC15_9BURK|nr:hypothetical protein Cenrod_1644 [Candidatus Symbiobacter mobilis CR]